MEFNRPGKWTALFGAVLLSQSLVSAAFADDAAVLPKGSWIFPVDSEFSLPIEKRFDHDGHVEDAAKDFNTPLDSNVFSGLTLLEGAFGLPPGSASFGQSVVSFKWDIKRVTFSPAYGLTDRLSIGIVMPYSWKTNRVDARLDPSTATIGINPGVPGGLAPLVVPGTRPPTTEDIQNLLVSQGFKKVETWSDNGIGDIEAGGRYQYFKSDAWRLAFTGGIRLPTGQVDDPDNLVDQGFGNGAYALLFRLNQDFIRQPEGITKKLGIPDPGAFMLNTTFRYDLYLPDKQELRVCSIHEPLCPVKDNVDRNLGDIMEAEISGAVGLPLKGSSFSALYKIGHSTKDHYSGNKGLDYGSLAIETNPTEQVYALGLTYSTLPLFLEKKFPFPLTASVSFRDRFAGTNNLLKSQFIGFTVAAYL